MRLPLLLTMLALIHGEASAQVMRWVDEQGGVHYGTTVPDRYRSSARQVAIDKPPSEAAQREAEARLQKDREALTRPPAASPAPPAGKPETSSKEARNCEEQWRGYDASWACFNPFRNRNGSVKGDAYEFCKEVAMPNCERPDGTP